MAYLEVQIKNEKDFAIARTFSDYNSPRTKVCSFSPGGVKNLNAYHPEILKPYLDNKNKAILDKGIPTPTAIVTAKGKVFIENGNIEVLSFLDVRSLANPEMKIVNMWKLFDLIEAGLVKASNEFLSLMSHVNEDTLVTELFASTGSMKFRNKLWSLKNLGEDFRIKDLDFAGMKSKEKHFMNTGDLVVKEYYADSKTLLLHKIGDHKMYTANFFYVTPNMISMFQKGKILSLATEKAYGSKESESKLVNPIILPRGFKMKNRTLLTCPRTIPSALYNAAYAEYLFRSKKTEEDDV